MTRCYFGTDGIRGKANEKLTPELALKVGKALGTVFQNGGERRHKAVIGKDTRLSGYMLEYAMASGLASVGMDAILLGPMPTAAVARLTRSMRADVGIMITASHNPYEDNGIKIFGPDSDKLSDDVEVQIEEMLGEGYKITLAPSHALGRVKKDETNRARYVEFIKMITPNISLEGLRIVVDCANGAAYRSAPEAFQELGAEVIPIGIQPDGFNINHECGSTALQTLKDKVQEVRADIGIAFDGDADRVLIIDEHRREIDGDQVLGILARRWRDEGRLNKSVVVGTVMSNIGLERFLRAHQISLERTPVGDHHILECMRAHDYSLGGEPSGHTVLNVPNFGMIGDGLATALQALAVLKIGGYKASEALHCFDPVPQVLRNVKTEDAKKVLEASRVVIAIDRARLNLGSEGRLVVRTSGTEPVIRIMIECDDLSLGNGIADAIEYEIASVET